MKTLFLLLFLPLVGFSQLTDTTCIKARWIALQRSEVNMPLFDSTMLISIRDLAEQNKIELFDEVTFYGEKGKWYSIPPVFTTSYSDNMREEPFIDTTERSFMFKTIIYSDIPMLDDYGDPIIKVIDGVEMYIYPPPDTVYIHSVEKIEYRIKEEKINGIMIPVALSFSIDYSYAPSQSMFWIDLKEFFEKCPNVEQYDWYHTIKNQTYRGFQYLQSSCYDNVIRY